MPRETSRTRRSRIELDYYKQRDGVARWRTIAALLLGAAVLGWVGLAPRFVKGRAVKLFQWKQLASPGTLSTSHTLWSSRCEACHLPFETVGEAGLKALSGESQATLDQRCQNCHQVAEHHANHPRPGMDCASCHTEHKGAANQLSQVSDFWCVRCHRDLPGNRKPGTGLLSVAARVTGFDGEASGHPEFALIGNPSLAGTANAIDFNHARHLSPGMARTAGGSTFRYRDLPEKDRARYGWASSRSLDEPVELVCASCHELRPASGVAARQAAFPPGGVAGAYMLPVSFEGHCRACHPLSFDPALPEATHGVQPESLLDEVERGYQSLVWTEHPEALESYVPPRAMPGRSDDALRTTLRQAISSKVATAARLLLSTRSVSSQNVPRGCALCHQYEKEPADNEEPDSLKAYREFRIMPPAIPRVWFQRAVFDHHAHGSLDCLACHANAASSQQSNDLLLPGKQTCLECHGPETRQSGQRVGGADASCVVCHRYHQEESATNPGSPRLGIVEFLTGAVPSTATPSTKRP